MTAELVIIQETDEATSRVDGYNAGKKGSIQSPATLLGMFAEKKKHYGDSCRSESILPCSILTVCVFETTSVTRSREIAI